MPRVDPHQPTLLDLLDEPPAAFLFVVPPDRTREVAVAGVATEREGWALVTRAGDWCVLPAGRGTVALLPFPDRGAPTEMFIVERPALLAALQSISTLAGSGAAVAALRADVIALDGVRLLGTLKAYSDAPTVHLEYASGEQPIAISIVDARTVLVPHKYREDASESDEPG